MTNTTGEGEANDFAAVLSSIRPKSARELGEALQLLEEKGTRTADGVTGTVYGPAGKPFPWRSRRQQDEDFDRAEAADEAYRDRER